MQQKNRRRLLVVIATLVAIIVGLRVYAPIGIKNYLNQSIHNLKGYDGHVADVDLHLLRAGFSVQNVVIYKESMSEKTPLFRAKELMINLRISSLFAGHVIGNVALERPELKIVIEDDQEASQEAKDVKEASKKIVAARRDAKTQDMLHIIPVRIDHFRIHNGRFTFTKLDTKPDLYLAMTDIKVNARNLTNSKNLSDTLVAKLDLSGKPVGGGTFQYYMAMNPLSEEVSFDVKAKLLNLPAKALNPITKEYGKFDFEKGTVSLVTEVAVRQGYMDGYVKPLLRDVEIHGKKDKTRDKDPPLRRFWEALIGAGEEVVENQTLEQSGTRVKLKGQIAKPNVPLDEAAIAVLRNAFVKALLPEYEPGEPDTSKVAKKGRGYESSGH